MERQKQVDECLTRCLKKQPALEKHKLSATLVDGVLTLYHYHHKLLVYNLNDRRVLHQWSEKPTDLRILKAALAFLRDTCGTQLQKQGADPAASSSQSDQLQPRAESAVNLVTCSAQGERLSLGSHGECRLVHGDRIEDRGSVFMAHLAFPVKSQAAASAALTLIRNHSGAASATHNICAYRVAGLGSAPVEVGCDDDGEDHAGTRLQSVLKAEGVVNVAVVVSRWYGGVNIGKARFQHICTVARTLLQRSLMANWGTGQKLDPNVVRPLDESALARREQQAAAAERRAAAFLERGSAAVRSRQVTQSMSSSGSPTTHEYSPVPPSSSSTQEKRSRPGVDAGEAVSDTAGELEERLPPCKAIRGTFQDQALNRSTSDDLPPGGGTLAPGASSKNVSCVVADDGVQREAVAVAPATGDSRSSHWVGLSTSGSVVIDLDG